MNGLRDFSTWLQIAKVRWIIWTYLLITWGQTMLALQVHSWIMAILHVQSCCLQFSNFLYEKNKSGQCISWGHALQPTLQSIQKRQKKKCS
uniref:Hypothetical secreted protein 1108 n=1 Tax=Amblyomma variegatum TaxID=34610 RepID=F0J9S6_AMBVA|nr:TPA_inf: hypothetical secreted protein 1108 [Amblyomma variegatum]